MLRSGGEEIIVLRIYFENRLEEVTLDSIVCLIVIDSVDADLSLNNTTERVIGGEDQLVNTSSPTYSIVTLDSINFGAAGEVSLFAI